MWKSWLQTPQTETARASQKKPDSAADRTFHPFAEEAVVLKDLKLTWNKSIEEKFASGASENQALAATKERKRLDLLHKLKAEGGSFTCAEEVNDYMLSKKSALNKRKQKKLEIQFLRDSSTHLPKTDPLFRIYLSLPNKKRRDKTPQEFSVALKAILGEKSDSSKSVSLDNFRVTLRRSLSSMADN